MDLLKDRKIGMIKVKGNKGIGKTAFVLALANYLNERVSSIFGEEIYYIDLQYFLQNS